MIDSRLAVRVGFGLRVPAETAQVIDSIKPQKRQNGSFRRFEVHGGYTAQQSEAKMFWPGGVR